MTDLEKKYRDLTAAVDGFLHWSGWYDYGDAVSSVEMHREDNLDSTECGTLTFKRLEDLLKEFGDPEAIRFGKANGGGQHADV